MCGRFILDASPEELADYFDLDKPPALAPRFNIAPSQLVAVVGENPSTGARALRLVKWGLVPEWSQDGKPGPINARAETVARRDIFAQSFRRRRCLIPTTGFYEWTKAGQQRLPNFIHAKGGGLMAFAGLWSIWKNPDTGKVLPTCCMLTTQPNEVVKPLHDRMPVILRPDDYASWLDNETELAKLKSLLKPYPAELMEAWRVSEAVNKATAEGRELVQPLEVA